MRTNKSSSSVKWFSRFHYHYECQDYITVKSIFLTFPVSCFLILCLSFRRQLLPFQCAFKFRCWIIFLLLKHLKNRDIVNFYICVISLFSNHRPILILFSSKHIFSLLKMDVKFFLLTSLPVVWITAFSFMCRPQSLKYLHILCW